MYIDPNSGGMLFQALALMFGAISAIILFFSSQIRMFFARLRRSNREGEEAEDGEDLAAVEGSAEDE